MVDPRMLQGAQGDRLKERAGLFLAFTDSSLASTISVLGIIRVLQLPASIIRL